MATSQEGTASIEELAQLEAQVAEQAAKVRDLKKSKAPQDEIKPAVAELLRRKKVLENATPKPWDRSPFEDLLKRRFIYAPAFEVYGGVAGFYDYGPVGCAIKANFISAWREHFVLHDNMLEVDTPAMTPEVVLKASGHVDRFTDIMVKDMQTGECIRADHLLEDVMDKRMQDTKLSAADREQARKHHAQADAYSKEELQQIFKEFEIKSPAGNDLSTPEDFNMMFASQIGPSGNHRGFLRPETAQGIFLAFKRLYDFNNKRLPFAGAQIGMAYRNEISPRNGLLRVREFQMAEIEHFIDPQDKSCKHFESVKDVAVPLLPAASQLSGTPPVKMTIGDAVAQGVVDNETLGYFLGRIYLFLRMVGADDTKLRFRQHMKNEMAHYACECWDAELLTSYGWVECVGCADRSAYDLTAHTKGSGQTIEASVTLQTPVEEDVVEVVPDKKKMGPKFKKAAGAIMQHLASLSEEQIVAMEASLASGGDGVATVVVDGTEHTLDNDTVKIVRKKVTRHERKFVPSVIEPSFGIGRIIYCVLEHVYACRPDDEQRGYLRLPPLMAPVKCSLLPLSNAEEFNAPLVRLKEQLTRLGVSSRLDDSSVPIGRRYARTDEIGISFGITVDFQTKDDESATVRERDSMKQIRVKLDQIPALVADLANGHRSWESAVEEFGLINTAAEGSA